MGKLRSYNYGGYKLCENNSENKNVKTQVAEAKAVIGEVWAIG